MNPDYGITRHLPETDYEDAIERATAALQEEGFGVLTEIDVRATLKKKLDIDFPRYMILGACNPTMAHRALLTDAGIGLLLPCNVVVAERAAGGSTVSAISPQAMFQVVENPEMDPVVEDVESRLRRVIASL